MNRKEQVLNDFRAIRRALLIIWNSSRKWTMINLILILIQGLLPLVSLYLLKLIVDTISERANGQSFDAEFNQIVIYILIWGGTSLLVTALNTIAQLIEETQQQELSDHIQQQIHRKSTEIEYAYYENPAYYDTLHRAQKESAFRPLMLMRNLTQATQSSISLVAIMGLLLTFHSVLVFALIVAVIPMAWVKIKNSQQLYHWFKSRTLLERKSNYFSHLLTDKKSAKEIRLYHLAHFYMNKFRLIRKQVLTEKLNLKIKQIKISLLANSSETIALLGSFIFVGYQGISGAITIGSLVMFIQAYQKGQQLLSVCIKGLTGVYEQKLFLFNLFEFLDLPEADQSSKMAQPRKINDSGLVVHDVSFKYPSTHSYAVQNVNLAVRPGEMIAIVGENGSGKSTLVKLISQLYQVESGKITFHGQSIDQIQTKAYQKSISVLFQDFSKYDMTVKENIAGQEATSLEHASKVELMSKYSGADRFITHLPNQYETLLGKRLGAGAELSGGEWQRIALSRAYFKDAELIILDEPTSFMDGSAEGQFLNHLKELRRSKMIIMISHRLSNIQWADRIYVMDHGRIQDMGKHEDLVSRSDLYGALFSAQKTVIG